MPIILDPMYFIIIAPALLLAGLAQLWMWSAYRKAKKVVAPLSGAAAARHILDSAGLHDVGIEQVPGELSDHYDPHARVLRLSPHIYNERTAAAVGVAAHEAGHALQHAVNYGPLVIHNMAWPVYRFGSTAGVYLLLGGMIFYQLPWLLWAGIVVFSGVVLFQLLNLPVEFDASSRAKALLIDHEIVPREQIGPVSNMLYAAALTYVAGALQAVLTLAYFLLIAFSRRD